MELFLRALRCRHFHSLLKQQNPPHYLQTPPPRSPSIANHFRISISPKSTAISLSAHSETESIHQSEEPYMKKPLPVFFKEAVGLAEKLGTMELKKESKKLEEEVSMFREEPENNETTRSRSLSDLFGEKEGKNYENSLDSKSLKADNPLVWKELSPDMIMLATHLYKQGYFNDASFLSRNRVDSTLFEDSYGRGFLRFAAEKFGKDNQEIAKCLSGSELKKVALFGCPSLARKAVFSAKRLRTFFRIQENTVCSNCVLKQSCKYVNQNVWEGDTTKNLNLAVVMRVITSYALEEVHPQLMVPEEVKASVSKLLKDILSLSLTVQ